MNEFSFNIVSENTIEFDLSRDVFNQPWSKKSTNLMFVFRDLTYDGSGDVLNFKLNIFVRYP